MFLSPDSAMPVNWRKSTYSGQSGNCAEAASGGGAVLVRDTQDRGGPVLVVGAAAWARFTASLR